MVLHRNTAAAKYLSWWNKTTMKSKCGWGQDTIYMLCNSGSCGAMSGWVARQETKHSRKQARLINTQSPGALSNCLETGRGHAPPWLAQRCSSIQITLPLHLLPVTHPHIYPHQNIQVYVEMQLGICCNNVCVCVGRGKVLYLKSVPTMW